MPLQEVHTGFTFGFDGSKLAAIQKGVGRASTNLNTIAARTEAFSQRMGGFIQRARQVVGVYLGFRAVRLITSDYATGADAVAKFSTALGLSTERYQGLIHAVKLGGTDTMNLNNALGQLSKRALEAGQGLSTNVRAFRELGVEWNDAKGNLKSADQLFLDVADGLVNLEDKEKRTGLAMQLLGRSGKTLLPTLLQGSAAIREQIAEAKKLGNVLSKDQLKAAEKFNDEMLRVKSILSGLRNIIAAKLLPAITKQLTAFRKWWVEGRNAERALRALKLVAIFTGIVIARLVGASVLRNIKMFVQGIWAGVQALRAMGVAGAFAALKIWAILAAVILVAAVIDDFIGFMQGRDSVIGRFFGDGKIGKELKKSIIDIGKALKAAWKDLKPALLDAWKAIKPAIDDLWKAIKPLIGPAFTLWIKGVIIYLKVVTFASKGVTVVVKEMASAFSAANSKLNEWDVAISNSSWGKKIASEWKEANDATNATLNNMEREVKAAWKAIGDAWDSANAGITKGFDKVISGAKTVLSWLGIVTGKPNFSRLVKMAIGDVGRKVQLAQPAQTTSTGGPIMPGLLQPFGGLIGGPIQSFAAGPGFQPPPQSVTANIAAGAVPVTVNVPSGDPAAIAKAINAALPPAISEVFTKASRDLVKPPQGQR